MRRRHLGLWVAPFVAVMLLSACREVSEEHVIEEPAKVEPLESTDVARITLTGPAAERLDIQTVPVEQEEEQIVVPSAAVMVDPGGVFWVYTSPQPLVFIRHEISIDHETGDRAYLSGGPPAGTAIVTVGVPELYGAETGIGK